MKLKVLYQKPFILTFLIAITYVFLILDTVKYPGFIGKHFLVDARIYFAISAVLLFIWPLKSRLLKFILKTSFATMAGLLLIYVWFSVVEATHYANYVLSKYHFSLEGLIYVLLFSVMVFIVPKIEIQKLAKVEVKNFWQVILFLFAAYTVVVNVGGSLKTASVSDIYVILHLKDSYDQKMYDEWGDFYNYMHFVKNNTPENANIVIPPQIEPWWTRSGNLRLVRYFLYPRNLIQYGTEEIPDVKSLPQGTYIMIAWGEWGCDQYGCKGWPEQTIKTKEAIYKNPNSFGVKEIKENFLYNPIDTSNPFGLLKL